jgi:hypothetical protein
MSDPSFLPHDGRGEPPLGERHYDQRLDGTYYVARCCDPCGTSWLVRPSRPRKTAPRKKGKSK